MTSTPQLLRLVLLAVVAWPWGSGSADFRFISYEDLLPSADLFVDSGVTTFSQLLFDISRDQVVVGAKDALYRLSLRGLMKLEKAPWPAPAEKASLCQDKGQSERYCHNFVKVLLSSGKRLFTCGTNAFSPQCSWREMENINHILEHVKGVAKCPYSPHSNVTALLSRTGQYFVGSPMDFSGADPAISRSLGGSPLRTNQYNSKWLNDPQFVGSFEDNNFVYFLFRESAVEYINCGKIVYSRIARMCKNDSGGQLMLKDNWTTFVKARLNCSVPGEYPFYFDEIQGMAYVESEGMVYATFTTPSNSIAGSAICAFNMSAIANAFSGPFKHQDNPGAAWEQRHTPHRRHFECQASASLLESSRYQLMDSAVQPATLKPLHTATLETLTHIAVDVLPTKLHRAVHVMYVATASGLVKKISVLPRTQETCIVEIWKPFSGDTPIAIKALHFLKETDSVYIGTEDNVLRIPAEHCSRLHSRMACQNAMDPYCGWNELKEQCTPAPNHNPLESFWKQSVTQCPVLTDPVDGGWSSWSSWFPCAHQSDSSGVITGSGSGEDQCKCKTRQCNNPPPQNGGAPCAGIAVSVTNCTVHGGWTAWSAWSACSQSCGMAVKTQRRTCGNPAPAHGGRVCVGQDRNEIYCTSNPPCPAVTPPPRDGQWGQWGPWDECSAPCGGGFRVRRRRCDNPAPEDGGQECQGCHLDYETCNTHACSEAKRLSSWTPWLAANLSTSSGGNGYTERRFRFSCRAPVADPALIKVAQAKEEERFCHHDGSCLRTGRGEADDVWSEWSNWSTCSVECGGGHQHRTRTCEGRAEDCEGPSRMSRMCNTHKCKGEWSCWSEWSGCSATCGQGAKQRTRHCLSVNNHGTVGSGCEGPSVGEEACESIACESLLGWEPWSVWSLCDVNDEQHRRRKCLTTNPGGQLCQGHDQETRMCVQLSSNALDPTWEESRSEEGGSVSVAVALGSCVAGFCVGSVLAGVLLYYYLKRRRPRIPGSPHYITSKQNPYVTVPLKEVGSSHHAKRAPSFSSSASSSNGSTPGSHKASNGGPTIGTPKLFAKPLVEYETATIKRNSHSLANGHIRADLDQDKFF